jgi:hypothetical protein
MRVSCFWGLLPPRRMCWNRRVTHGKENAMNDLELFAELVDVYEELEATIEEVKGDLAGLGMTDSESCPLAAFGVYDAAMVTIAGVLEEAAGALAEDAGEEALVDGHDGFDDLIGKYDGEIAGLGEQMDEFFELLEFDIEEVLVDMPPLNKERAEDEDAILFAAIDLDEMTEPWRQLTLLAQRHINEKLEYIQTLMARLLELLEVEGYEAETED